MTHLNNTDPFIYLQEISKHLISYVYDYFVLRGNLIGKNLIPIVINLNKKALIQNLPVNSRRPS